MEWQTQGGRPEVREICKVSEEYEVCLVADGAPPVIRIRILEYPDGRFMGVANYSVQAPGQGPYKSLQMKDSPQKALQDAISGLLAFLPDTPEKQRKTKWIEDEEF